MPVVPPRLDCGHRLSADELVARLCPKCLLRLGLASAAATGGSESLPRLGRSADVVNGSSCRGMQPPWAA